MRLALGTILLLCSCCASADYRVGDHNVFRCRDGSEMMVQYQRGTARVMVAGHKYQLVRTRSDLGKRFASPEATLIVDGEFAAFVADDLDHLRDCRAAHKA